MKKTTTYLMAAILAISLGAFTVKAQMAYPYFSNSEVAANISTVATTVANPSTALLDLTGNFTIEVSGTVGTEIKITNSLVYYSYTPTASGSVRFVKKDSKVYVYEGTTYKGTITSQPCIITYPTISDATATTSTDELLQNASFETTGALVGGTNYNFGTPWVTNVTVAASGGIRITTSASAVNGTYVCVWRGSGNSNYFAQPVSGIKANTSYQVIIRQVTSGNANADFNVGLGSTASGLEYGSTTIRLGTTYDGTRTAIFNSSFNATGTVYFTFKNTSANTSSTGSDPVTQMDYIALVEGTSASAPGITGTSGSVYFVNSVYSPQININYSAGDYYDMTSYIVNPSFESGNFNGWTNNGMATQTNNSPSDVGWTKDGNVYCEKWVNQSGNLPAAGITQTISGLPNGVYKLKAAGHAIKQGAADPTATTGAYIYAGTVQKLVNAGAEYEVFNGTVTGNSLAIGFKTEGTITSNWAAVDNFRLSYYGEATPIIAISPKYFLTFDELNTSGTFTVTGVNLTSDITITAPSGYTVNPTTLTSTASDATVTVTFDGIAESSGYITLTSGTALARVRVIGKLNSTKFKPLYSTGNLITDPYFNSLSTYGGWGSRSITNDTIEVYSGSKSYKSLGSCGSSVDFDLTGKLLANTKYRLKAMVNTDKEFYFTLNGCGINGSTSDYQQMINTNNTWAAVDFKFKTGTLASSQYLWMNSCSGSNRATKILMDNLELYVAPLDISSSSLTFLGLGTKKVAVTGNSLTNVISIIAPANFSVSPATLPAAVAGDSVAITYNGAATASGYVIFTSGTIKDSVQVTGTADPTIAPSANSLIMDDVMFKDSVTVTGANLISDITITPPAGITVNPTSISKTNATGIKVYVIYDGITAVNDSIVFTSGALVKKVGIKAVSNVGCFTPLYSSGNLIPDPYLNSLSAFSGWGTRSINTNPAYVYCGLKSGKISGGDIEINGLKINTTYRVKAKVFAVTGEPRVGVFHWNGTAGDINHAVTTLGSWQDVDFTFTTGATLGSPNGIFFNNSDEAYIDNWEVYEIPKIFVSSSSLIYAGASTKKIAVTAHKLTSDITITAPTGFSVTPSTLLSTVAGDSVAITYNGGANSSGYVYFTSGTVKDSVQVTGTADPTILASLTYLTFDEQNTQGTFTVTGGNLTTGITITVPVGYTVNPSSLSSTANGATVTVTYNGLTESKGYITLTSGTASARVRVLGSVFTPLYATGNLIADPSFNSMSTYEGWGGGKAITTDTTETFSGVSSLKMTGACGASTNYKLTGKVQPNTKYRLRLMAKTTGKFKVIAGNFNLVHVGNDDYIITDLNTNGEWKQIDTTFTSGSSFVAADQYLYINSCEGYGGTLALIDNYELYLAPSIVISPKSLTLAGVSTKKVAVTGSMLTNDISITAPAGFSVTPSTLLKTVAGDSVAITYDNSTDLSGYVVFKSGSIKDSVQVMGTALSSDATLSTLSISDGTLSPAFDAGTTTYSVVLSAGTTTLPTITATATEAHATIVITQTTSVTGSAMIVVTAQAGDKKTYTITFSLAAPAAPVASDAISVAKRSFTANWAASTGATGYFLDVATDNAFTAFVIGYNNLSVGNVTTYAVTDLTAATTYYYRIRATNGKVSANSNTISVLSLGTDVQSLAANGLKIAVTANTVELESNNTMVAVQVVNVNGKLMTEKSVNATKTTISTEGWASGIYVFTIKTQGQVITTKLGIVK